MRQDKGRKGVRPLNLLAERNAVELVVNGLVEAFADAVRLWRFRFGLRVIDVVDR